MEEKNKKTKPPAKSSSSHNNFLELFGNDYKSAFDCIFNNSRDAIMFLRAPDWKFFFGNSATMRLFGVKDNAEFESLTPYDLSPQIQPDGQTSESKAKAMISLALKNGFNDFYWKHKKYKREEFDAEVHLTRMKVGDKEFLQAIVRDTTEFMRVQKSQSKLLLAVENSDDAIYSKDKNSIILSWNKGAENIYGFKAKEIIGYNVDLIVPPSEKKELAVIMREVFQQGKKFEHFHTLRQTKDGRKINMSLTISPIVGDLGKIDSATVVGRDITGQIHKERLLSDKLAELERINKLMIGRELKMVELKREIGVLKNKLNKK